MEESIRLDEEVRVMMVIAPLVIAPLVIGPQHLLGYTFWATPAR